MLEGRSEHTQDFIVKLAIRGIAGTGGKKWRPFPKWTNGRWGQSRTGPRLKNLQQTLIKRFDCCRFVVFHIENGIEFGDLEQVVHFFGQIQQLEFATLVAHRSKRANQFTDA